MPVTQLTNQQGGLGTVLGLVGGYLAGNPERKAKQAEQQYQHGRDAAADAQTAKTNARADAQAKVYADDVTSQIKARDASAATTTANDANTQIQRGLFTKYAALVKAGPPAGVPPAQWAASLQSQANADGLTDKNLREQLISDGQAVVASRAPKLKDVEQGLPQLPTGGNGKPAPTPQQISQHYMDAAARALQSDMSPDEKKLAVEHFQKMAADALKNQPKPETAEEKYARTNGVRMPTYAELHPKPAVGRTPSAQEQYFIDHGYSPPTYSEANPRTKEPVEKPRALSVADDQAIRKQAQVALRDPKADPNTVAQSLADEWGIPFRQARSFVPGAAAAPAKAPAGAAAAPRLPGTGKSLSREQAIKAGGPDGVAKAQALGYTVH